MNVQIVCVEIFCAFYLQILYYGGSESSDLPPSRYSMLLNTTDTWTILNKKNKLHTIDKRFVSVLKNLESPNNLNREDLFVPKVGTPSVYYHNNPKLKTYKSFKTDKHLTYLAKENGGTCINPFVLIKWAPLLILFAKIIGYFLATTLSTLTFIPCLVPRPIVHQVIVSPTTTTTAIPITEITSTTQRTTTTQPPSTTTLSTTMVMTTTTTTPPPIIYTCPPCFCGRSESYFESRNESFVKQIYKPEINLLINEEHCIERMLCEGRLEQQIVSSQRKRTKYKHKIANLIHEMVKETTDQKQIVGRIIYQALNQNIYDENMGCEMYECKKIESIKTFVKFKNYL